MKIIGALDEKNSFLYDIKIPVSKILPLMEREELFFKLSGFISEEEDVEINNIFSFNFKDKKEKNEIIFHIGASKKL